MSKRKSKEIDNSTAAKVCRLAAAGGEDEDEEEAESQQTPAPTGDIGLIESISLQNFMCHHLLGPFQFGSNVNFIVGNNGSGKSAILTALIVGLGGKATVTNRGVSLKDFVKTGETHADITVKLRNRGPDAYKKEAYGECISIEHRILTDGSRTYKLRSKSDRLVSNKKEELIAILDHFNIQLDNPVSILSQEMSKQFLHSKNESDKYKFFMKATLLEQMKRDYFHIKHTQTVTRQQVERQEELLADLKQDYLQKKQKYENLSSLGEMKEALEKLRKAMAWCLVREKEVLVQQLRDEVEKEESNCRDHEKLQLCQTRVIQVEKKLQSIRNQLETLKEEQRSLSKENTRLKDEVKAANRAHKEQELVYSRALNKLRQSEQEQNLIQERINKARSSGGESDCEHAGRQQSLSGLREQLAALEEKCSQLNQEINSNNQALIKGQEERDKLRLEERIFRGSYESKLKRRNQLLASQSNRLKRFGECVPDLLDAVARAAAAGRFIKRPIGPIGACLSLKDPSLAMAVESCLRSFMKAFCCDNYRDEALLQELMSRCYPRGNRPQIIVSPYLDRVYNVHGRKAQHPEFSTVLDVITASSHVVINCLIDMRGIESILIIKEKDIARRVMQQSAPPRNCREAFTAEGDQVYPNRYYTSDFNMAKFLGGDLEAEIRMLETEVENQRAQLSRFELQVNSVCKDIQKMESRQSSTITTLKKTMASVSQLKASITELEMKEEENTDGISSLEEDARENRQKIEVEERTVHEAKTEFNNYRKMLDIADCNYSSAKDRIVQLSEDMEPLREEQLKLEAECAKLERNLKIFENKTKAHEENIQAMRSELSQREEVLQEYMSKATVISPKRQPVNRSAKSLDKEIIILEKKIEVHESSYGRQEQVLREYAEAQALYREKTMQTRDLRRFVDQLDNIISDRQNRYKIMRRSLSVRCKLYFNNFLNKMKCCGSMIFNHDNETLAISIQPPGSEDAGVRDMRSLSGGERSFSTVCFMLSLWEITESPFRCLDEFDVYMDMHNRRISLDLLLELSERQHLRQFIFITPLTTRSLPTSSFIKIHQLQRLQSEQKQTGEEEEAGGA